MVVGFWVMFLFSPLLSKLDIGSYVRVKIIIKCRVVKGNVKGRESEAPIA